MTDHCPKPYWSGDGITVYHADCREWLGWSHLGDVLITDPPYGVSYVSNSAIGGFRDGIYRPGSTTPINGDNNPALRDDILVAWGPSRPALVFGSWKVTRPEDVRQLLVWDKGDSPGMGDLDMPWGPGHEEIYVFGHGWKGRRRSNVLRVPTYGAQDKERPKHPTPKPITLMEMLIEYAPEGLIVDPFMGSGSTLRAARAMGREAIGVEVSEEYCELAVSYLSQGVLF